MQQNRRHGIGGEPSRQLLAASESVKRNRASRRLATAAVSLNPVLKDELNARGERHHAVRSDRRAAAMQLADEVRYFVQGHTRVPLRERRLARDGLQQERPQRCVGAPHERYTPRGLPTPQRRRLRARELRVRRELEDSGATVAPAASEHQGGVAASNRVADN